MYVSDIEGIACLKNDIYIMQADGFVKKLSLHTIPKLVSHVYSLGYLDLASNLILQFHSDLLRVCHTKYVSVELVMDLIEKVDGQIREQLSAYLTKLNTCIERYIKSKETTSHGGKASACGFFQNEQGIYVRTQRSISACSDDLPDPNDLLMQRVLTHKGDDSKSHDSISIGSIESEGPKTTTVVDQAKNTLLTFKDKLKQKLTKTPIKEIGGADMNHKAEEDSKSDTPISSESSSINTTSRNNDTECSMHSEAQKDSPAASSYESDMSKQHSPSDTSQILESTSLPASTSEKGDDSSSQKSLPTDNVTNVERDPSSDSLSMSSSELSFSQSTSGIPGMYYHNHRLIFTAGCQPLLK